jgi:hypothetical protein
MLVAAGAVASVLAAPITEAQVLDFHAIGSVETVRQSTSWGGGLGVGTLYVPLHVAMLGVNVGADYIREQHLGKGRVTVSLDGTLSPANSSGTLVPYVGGGIGLNWSGGQASQWTGSRVGLDVILGIKALLGHGDRVGWKLEQRYGYVQGYEHAFATRLGLLVGL